MAFGLLENRTNSCSNELETVFSVTKNEKAEKKKEKIMQSRRFSTSWCFSCSNDLTLANINLVEFQACDSPMRCRAFFDHEKNSLISFRVASTRLESTNCARVLTSKTKQKRGTDEALVTR